MKIPRKARELRTRVPDDVLFENAFFGHKGHGWASRCRAVWQVKRGPDLNLRGRQVAVEEARAAGKALENREDLTMSVSTKSFIRSQVAKLTAALNKIDV